KPAPPAAPPKAVAPPPARPAAPPEAPRSIASPEAPVRSIASPEAPRVAASAAGEPAKRRSSEIDLSQLDELARPRTKTGTGSIPRPTPPSPTATPVSSPAAEGFRTQRLPTFPSLTENREFGQYTLLDRIAVGGMAEVWKARMKGVEGFQKTV